MGGMMGGGGSKGANATAGGGVSPEQTALAQYDFGQAGQHTNQTFSQIPLSTNKTQAWTGDYGSQAFQLASMSDKDAQAMAQAINQQANQTMQGIGQLASGLGSLAGGGG